ncbi:conserved hypothetical protein [Pseudomonas sp. 8Z]|uniref:hypothetical protein n=1 Tax=Pseudomonas TaxID=286 RepID=UPI0012EF6987|nr:hypothetical protein [Pseudomonas sp. 8Z]VXC69467.1 conserved hypothetical protein [Pseudomonas sp. 8Z]
MSCTITYITNAQPGQDDRAHKRGRIPRKPVQWQASVWMIAPGGEKTTHSITVPACTAQDLIPAIGDRIDALARENGQICVQFGWTASAHGGMKKNRKGGKR